MFCGSDEGGKTASVLFSFTASGKHSKIDPLVYLIDPTSGNWTPGFRMPGPLVNALLLRDEPSETRLVKLPFAVSVLEPCFDLTDRATNADGVGKTVTDLGMIILVSLGEVGAIWDPI